MKTKIQIKTIFGKLLFEFEKDDNSIRETLIEAVKQGANLRGADLWEANLRGADLQGANLRGADFRGADLQGANLQGANLRGADLQGANLRGADFREADLRGADFRGADLRGADLKKIYAIMTILPEGELIIWKKLKDNLIAKLIISKETQRVNAIGSRKCRFEYAKVLAIYDGRKKVKEGEGLYSTNLIYKEGEIVRPDSFDDSPLIECSHGIHGFITKQEAIDFTM